MSVTSTCIPLGVAAMPVGLWNVATSEKPLTFPAAPVPEAVVTARVFTSTCRMRRLVVSATHSTDPERATWLGALNRALVPTPSAKAAVLYLPASVVTVRVATSILRMRSAVDSATKTVAPSGVTSIPQGPLNCAFAPMPSALFAAPDPASVVTVCVATATLCTL